jgi:hypothetical protein
MLHPPVPDPVALDAAGRLIDWARRIVALTGAGMSTDSGRDNRLTSRRLPGLRRAASASSGSTRSRSPSVRVKGITVSLAYPDAAKGKAIFEALSAGGTVTMPYQTTFWADGLRHVHRQVRHTVDGQCRQPEVLEDALDDLRLQDAAMIFSSPPTTSSGRPAARDGRRQPRRCRGALLARASAQAAPPHRVLPRVRPPGRSRPLLRRRRGLERVLDLVEDACEGLLAHVRRELAARVAAAGGGVAGQPGST